MINIWKEGSKNWWRAEIIRAIENQMENRGRDELGNMLPELHREIDKAIWLWENTVRV